jgi:hypothetical protein
VSDPRLTILDELQLYIREQLERIDQLHSDADRKRQELDLAPKLWRIKVWKVVVAAFVASGIICGTLGYMLGTIPPTPIIIQLKEYAK